MKKHKKYVFIGLLALLGAAAVTLTMCGKHEEKESAGGGGTSSADTSNRPEKKDLSNVKVTADTWQAVVREMGKEKVAELYVEKMINDPSFENRIPINFYGKIVDQFGNPVEGAQVDMWWWTIDSPTGKSERTVHSDSQGMFSLAGKKGKRLVMSFSKEGYYGAASENQTSFEYADPYIDTYHDPDPRNPVKFLMRKKGTPANLFRGDVDLRLREPGASSGIDLFAGKAAEAGQGQMQVTTWKPDLSEKEAKNMSIFPYDWKIKLEIGDGGFIANKDHFPLTAPENGYQTTIEENLHAEGGNSAGILFKRTFYFRVGKPPYNYGLMRVFAFGDDKGVQVTYMLNTTPGDRNLETGSEKDVYKFLR